MNHSKFNFTAVTRAILLVGALCGAMKNGSTVNAACASVPPGIVAWWQLDNNALDLIGGHGGTVSGDFNFSNAVVGVGLNLTAAPAGVLVTNAPDLNFAAGADFSIEVWIQPQVASTAFDVMAIVDKRVVAGSANALGYAMYLSSGRIGLQLSDNINDPVLQGGWIGPDLRDGLWHHVAATIERNSSTGGRLYVDGSTVAVFDPTSKAGSLENEAPLLIGSHPSYPDFDASFRGGIDEVSIYNRALTAAEVGAIYLAGSGGKCVSPAPPVIVAEPADVIVYIGDTAQFNVLSLGSGPLAFQWYFNETNVLAGATDASLLITNAQASDAGGYVVRVTNSVGSVTSRLAALTAKAAGVCLPPPSGLVGWWKGEFNALDEIGTNNGALIGAVQYGAAEAGAGFVFTGSSQAVNLGNPEILQLQDFTIEAWIKRSSISSVSFDNSIGMIFAFGSGGYGLYLDYSGSPTLTKVEYNAVSPNVPISDTGFHHVAITKLSAQVIFYIDGKAYPAAAYDPGFEFSSSAQIGAWGPAQSATFNGCVDELSVYNRPLDQAEITALYKAGAAGKCTKPTAPVVFQQPKSQTVDVGSDVDFSAVVSGTVPLSYHWLFNETNVLEATSPTLNLTNVQFSQAGTYALQVSNAYGTILSSNAMLTVTSPPPCTVPPAGLVHWWPAENNAKDIAGTVNGIPEGDLQFGRGRVGTAFSFNGTDADVRIPASPDLNLGLAQGMTIEGWIRPETIATQQPLMEWSGTTYQTHLWISVQDPYSGTPSPGSLFANLVDTTGQYRWFASPVGVLTTRSWQHVALTYDKSTGLAGLYLNGALVAQQDLGIFVPDTTGDLYLGLRPAAGYQAFRYSGLMDEISVYGRALSPEEIRAVFSASSSGKCTGPTAPVVFQQPKDKTVEAGSDVIISALASGTAPLSYYWLFNETNVLEGASSTLSLTNVQLSQAGTYALQVSNAYGIALSSNAILTVTAPPPCTQPAADLVSWWRGDAGAWDELGGNSGALSNNVSFGKGKVGQAFVFDGDGDAILLGNPANLQLQSLTLEGWIKRASTTKVSQGTPGSGYLFAFGPGGYGLMMDSGGWLNFGKVGAQMLYSSARVSDTNYHHVTVTKSGTSVAVYLDGVRRTSSSYPYSFTFANPAAIGARPDGLNGFWGNIDEFSIYKRALTAAEITSIYTAGVSGKCVTPTAPVVLAGLADQVATVGDTVSFGVSAGGTPPFSYQWTLNGTAIEGETSPSLLLTNVQMSQAGLYSVVVTNAVGATNSSAQLAVNFAPAVVRVPDTTAQAGRSITVPITIVANGNENAIGFSLNYTPSQLTYETVTLGGGIFGGMLIFNANEAVNGKLGVAVSLPAGATLSAGLQELALVTFRSAILTNSVVSTLSFGDSPIGRQLSDAPGNTLPANYTAGTVAITAAELEGDVSPRPGGDHNVTITDWVLVGRCVAQLDSPTNTSEFQHADCAPRSTLGDGVLSLIDWVQAGRYAARLDDLTLTGGPIGASLQGSGVVAFGSGTRKDGEIQRQIKVADAEIVPGLQGNVSIQLVSQGNENAIGFSLLFDPAVLTYQSASAGADAPAASLTVNDSQAAAGRVALLLALPPGADFAAGTKDVVRLAFKLAASASGTSAVSLTDQPVRREVSDAFALSLPADYVSGKITVGALPTLAIAHAGGLLTLAWPAWATNFVAQEAVSLEATSLNWTNVPASPVLSNGQNVLQVPAPASTRFFRLQLAQ